MRFYADVNFNGHVVRGLVRRGVDVLTVRKDGRGETLDPDLLDRAGELGRVLLTHDDDFLSEAARRRAAGIDFAGVVYAPQRHIAVGNLIEDPHLISVATDEAYWSSHVEYLPC